MITNKELEEVRLSPTKKDFYQIWNELLETASKISERWDPTSTNESDPGIVLLKVLTACADKLNYTIDKNILEAYMPSATQEESMRKLCEMLGYNMKYYRSATTDVTISYIGKNKLTDSDTSILIPMNTYITNNESNIVYCTLKDVVFNDAITTKTVEAIEGQLVECKTNDGNIITLAQIDDSYRYYFPESQIAENGIFVYDVDSSEIDNEINTFIGEEWKSVYNLNTQEIKTKCYKFGYDSRNGYPYIQFPEDIGNIIGDGLFIRYIRTNGANGNIAQRKLSAFQNIDDLIAYNSSSKQIIDNASDFINIENFTINNASSTNTGKNAETIDDAYNGFKKIIGTFDTLVTCRDYMNAIYNMTVGDFDDSRSTQPLVSNVIVSDIRDDINRAYTICQFDEYGIKFINTPATMSVSRTVSDGTNSFTFDEKVDRINHFDIVLYPFKAFKEIDTLDNKREFNESFKYCSDNLSVIKQLLEHNKTLSHSFIDPDADEIACIKNMVKLKAKITTNYKVAASEEREILKNVYNGIYRAFNMRNVDFGEEIPFDAILKVIEESDTRIKNVALEEPTLETKFCLVSGEEESVESTIGKQLFNKMVIQNIVAGKIPMFNYKKVFATSFDEKAYPGVDPVLPADSKKIVGIKSEFNPQKTDEPLKLNKNEVIQFRAPNFRSIITYPSYVNYFFHSNNEFSSEAYKPAVMLNIRDYLDADKPTRWNDLANFTGSSSASVMLGLATRTINPQNYESEIAKIPALFTNDGSKYNYIDPNTLDKDYVLNHINDYYFFSFNDAGDFSFVARYFRSVDINHLKLYSVADTKTTNIPGYLIDAQYRRYVQQTNGRQSINPCDGFFNYYVPDTSLGLENNYGLGIDANFTAVTKNTEYELKNGEYICFNYTEAVTRDDGKSEDAIINKVYGAGTIIRPSFDLSDSVTLNNNGAKFSKTSGYTFDQSLNVVGMYTLGTSQEIAIRQEVEVKFGDAGLEQVNIYWIRTDKDMQEQKSDKKVFIWDEEYNGIPNSAHTLKDGEYFFYTDANKLDVAYYGAGAQIIRTNTKIELIKDAADTDVDFETIALNGLAAGIPWRSMTLNTDKQLIIKEYQYVNLTDGDLLINCSTYDLNNTYKQVSDVEYAFAEEADSGKATHTLPKLSTGNWEARTRLNFDVGPANAQTLFNGDKMTVIFDDGSTKDIIPNDSQPLSIKTNYSIYSAADTVNVHVDVYEADDSQTPILKEHIDDFAIKQFDKESIIVNSGSDSYLLNLHNFSDTWTKISLAKSNADEKIVSLNNIIPPKTFGLLAMYYITPNNMDASKYAYLNTNAGKLSILSNDGKWWNGEAGPKYRLRPGLNIIQIDVSNEISLFTPDENNTDTILIADLDIIDKETPMNPRLSYNGSYEDLLADIKKIDPDHLFYYNMNIDQSMAIDINTSIPLDDEDAEVMANPRLLYDYNNVCNKFVISQIDTKALEQGVSIAKSSKKNY